MASIDNIQSVADTVLDTAVETNQIAETATSNVFTFNIVNNVVTTQTTNVDNSIKVFTSAESDVVLPDEGIAIILDGDKDLNATGNDNDNFITGNEGNNIIEGGDGDDQIDGGAGDDTITDGNGNDVVAGGDGNDIITSNDGDDQIEGGNGDDTLTDGSGNDVISGGSGDDTFIVGDGNDVCIGGEGNDVFVLNETDQGDNALTGLNIGDQLQISDRNGDGNIDGDDVQSIQSTEAGLNMVFVDNTSVTIEGVTSLEGINIEIDEDNDFAILS
ncbi:MAG: calcium-binding protein [Methylococcaceae bacterium]